MVNRYMIAGLKVEMTVRYGLLEKRSRKYLYDFDGQPDICINISDEELVKAELNHPECSAEESEYMFTGALFYLRMLKFGGFLIHSSCISYKGKAYLFSANSGVGKSTHTALWQKYLDGVEIINDDKPAIRLMDGCFYAIGTPWSGKHDKSSDTAIPIGGAVLLYRGQANKILPAEPKEAIPFLFKQTILPKRPENTEFLLDLLDKFLTTVPIYHFECDISEDAVKTSFETLTKQIYTFKG